MGRLNDMQGDGAVFCFCLRAESYSFLVDLVFAQLSTTTAGPAVSWLVQAS